MCSVCKLLKLCVMFICVASCSPVSHVSKPVIHKVPKFSIAYQHAPLINPMDKPNKTMENLLIKDFHNRHLSAKQAKGSSVSPSMVAPWRAVIAPNLTRFHLPLTGQFRAFDFSLTKCYKKAYSCLAETKQNKATESLLKKPLILWVGGNRDGKGK